MQSKDEHLPLHLKYRPKNFDEFFGNESVVESLSNILKRKFGEVRTFLLIGNSGCGKTTIARIMKKELNCSDYDYYEYNISQMRGIDTAREIIDNSRYVPMGGDVKIFVLNEVHKATNEFQNAMLEILEEPPTHVRFVLVTTDPNKLIKAIRTRCSAFQFSPLRKNQIIKLLRYVCEQEKVELSEKILFKVAEYSDGIPRQALVLLDQVIDVGDEEVSEQVLIDCTVDDKIVLDLCNQLLSRCKWEKIASTLKNMDEDPEKIRIAVLSYMAKVLLSKDFPLAAKIMVLFEEPFYNGGKSLLVLACYHANKL